MNYSVAPRFPGLVRIGIYALIPTLLVLSIIGYQGSRWITNEYLTHRAIKSAFANTYTDAIVQVERARSIPSIYDLLGYTDQADLHISSEALVALKLIAQLGTSVAQQNYKNAGRITDEITNTRPILESISRVNSFYTWTSIRDQVKPWSETIAKLSLINAQKFRTEEINSLKLKINALKDQLTTLIIVPFDRGEGQLGFYTEGVLADLPIIQGIPDALNSLEELRDSLKRVNGRVFVPKDIEDPKTYFTEKLEAFRATARELKSSDLFAALSSNAGNTDEIERQATQLTKELLQEISLLVSKLSVDAAG